MIWGGGGGNFQNEFIFSREPLPYKIKIKISFGGSTEKKNCLRKSASCPPRIINGRPLNTALDQMILTGGLLAAELNTAHDLITGRRSIGSGAKYSS